MRRLLVFDGGELVAICQLLRNHGTRKWWRRLGANGTAGYVDTCFYMKSIAIMNPRGLGATNCLGDIACFCGVELFNALITIWSVALGDVRRFNIFEHF